MGTKTNKGVLNSSEMSRGMAKSSLTILSGAVLVNEDGVSKTCQITSWTLVTLLWLSLTN